MLPSSTGPSKSYCNVGLQRKTCGKRLHSVLKFTRYLGEFLSDYRDFCLLSKSNLLLVVRTLRNPWVFSWPNGGPPNQFCGVLLTQESRCDGEPWLTSLPWESGGSSSASRLRGSPMGSAMRAGTVRAEAQHAPLLIRVSSMECTAGGWHPKKTGFF